MQVLHIADVLHGRPNDPLCVKALQRRAAALEALDQPKRAVKDLEAALAITGGRCTEIEEQLRRAWVVVREVKLRKQIHKAVSVCWGCVQHLGARCAAALRKGEGPAVGMGVLLARLAHKHATVELDVASPLIPPIHRRLKVLQLP